MSEKLKELISLLYQDKLTQCGKRLFIEKLQKENEELKERNEYYISKSVIQDKIEEIINNSTFGCVGCEWNDIEVVQLLENMLLDRRDK